MNKWIYKKYGYARPGKFYVGKSATKKRVMRSDKKKARRRLDKYFKDR